MDKLNSVVIPGSVTSIEDRAFENCSSLKSITIPDSVTSIGSCAFKGTKLYNDDGFIILAGTLVQHNGKGDNVIIPNTVTCIGKCAFSRCNSLTSITIPDSVTSISWYAFISCEKLVIIASENSYAIKYAKEREIKYQVI